MVTNGVRPISSTHRVELCLSKPGALTASLVGGYIQLNNNTNCVLVIDAIEVNHAITALIYEPGSSEPSKKVKRIIRERLSIKHEIPPHNSIRIYFGPVENIESITAIVELGEGRELRIRLPVFHFKFEKKEEESK